MKDKDFVIGAVLAALPLAGLLGVLAYVNIGPMGSAIAFVGFMASAGCAIAASHFWTK